MYKIEWIYRELLFAALEQRRYTFTQRELAIRFNLSLSTVHHALAPLRAMGAIEVKRRSFHLLDKGKLLYYWASLRTLSRDIVYATRVSLPLKQIEAEMPAQVIYGLYSAYKFRFHDVPADYSEVYVYANPLEIQKRFPLAQGTPNVFVLKKDTYMPAYGRSTTLAQTFVDLWNTREWYAKEFLLALTKRIGDL